MGSGLGMEYNGGGGGGGLRKSVSQFHSLFFMQAAVIAYNICLALRHSN